jgi:hypothetical protein
MSECVGGGCDVTGCDKERIIRRSSSEYVGTSEHRNVGASEYVGTSEACRNVGGRRKYVGVGRSLIGV